MMLGYLLARAGISVAVLEKHKDFFRDFRGDTVHPSTLEILYELGILEDFLKIPHQQLTSVGGKFGDFTFRAADFSHLPLHCRFVALMPQWDFLNFLAEKAKAFPGFKLCMEHEVTGLIEENGKIAGVEVQTPQGVIECRARLVVGCDGRHSVTRREANLPVLEFGVPIDVLWFRISRVSGDPEQLLGNINYGKLLVLINRGDYFQAGLIIAKGSFEQIQRRGIPTLQREILEVAPYLNERVEEIKSWEQIKLLSVQINRLRRWRRPGLLCIGDAAHAMSPAGGVGINLAIQDAVAAANLLARPLQDRNLTEADLARVEKRRTFPTAVMQSIQVKAHKGFSAVFANPGPAVAPWQLKLATRLPGANRLLGRLVGMGVRRERVRLPAAT
jgi:2-polyprenyl-6-methoxyphenol hydroxylase-like FAD-dependent oxidoreductase